MAMSTRAKYMAELVRETFNVPEFEASVSNTTVHPTAGLSAIYSLRLPRSRML